MTTSQPINVLVADDDKEDLELIEEAMRDYVSNLHFHKVNNGRLALEFLESKQDEELPCLIVLDYNMPELTGSQVLLELSKEPRYDDIAKVVLSTSSAPTHVKECKENGAVDYFVKPTNMGDLKQIVHKLLSYC